MKRSIFFILAAVALFGGNVEAQEPRKQLNSRPRYTYVRRNDSREGDQKVVTVPGIDARQAKLDAQTYNIGWDAIDAWPGQTRVMYNVLLKKRAPYIPGTPPIPKPVPGERRGPQRR